jgi:hypothetical protein
MNGKDIFVICCIGISAIIANVINISQTMDIHNLREQQCNCTVNINGSVMSVEDGFYHLIEGLSADQAQEVQIMINNSLEAK